MTIDPSAKHLLGATRSRLVDLLLEGPRTSSQLGREVGIHLTAVRQHLEGLERNGLVVSSFRQEGMGRPKKYYALTTDGRELLPRRYQLLLELVFSNILSRHGEKELGEIMAAVAHDITEKLPHTDVDAPLDKRMIRLVESLNELGFKAKLSREGGKLAIIRTNCIFHGTANTHHDLVCNHLDAEVLRQSLGNVRIELVQCQSKGDACCKHVVTPVTAAG